MGSLYQRIGEPEFAQRARKLEQWWNEGYFVDMRRSKIGYLTIADLEALKQKVVDAKTLLERMLSDITQVRSRISELNIWDTENLYPYDPHHDPSWGAPTHGGFLAADAKETLNKVENELKACLGNAINPVVTEMTKELNEAKNLSGEVYFYYR